MDESYQQCSLPENLEMYNQQVWLVYGALQKELHFGWEGSDLRKKAQI